MSPLMKDKDSYLDTTYNTILIICLQETA